MKKKSDLSDLFLEKIKYIGITIGLIMLMLTWSAIPSIILIILNINIESIPNIIKILYTFIFDIIFLLLIASIYKQEITKEFKAFFTKKNILNNIKKSLKYWSIGMIIMISTNAIIALFTNNLAANEQAVREMIDKYPLYMAFQVMIYAPISEEIIFRKSIDKIFKNKYLYILISGLIFGGLHVISSITSLIDILYLLPYCSLGFVFALLYKNTNNNIFSTITAHAFHNTLALLLYLL